MPGAENPTEDKSLPIGREHLLLRGEIEGTGDEYYDRTDIFTDPGHEHHGGILCFGGACDSMAVSQGTEAVFVYAVDRSGIQIGVSAVH